MKKGRFFYLSRSAAALLLFSPSLIDQISLCDWKEGSYNILLHSTFWLRKPQNASSSHRRLHLIHKNTFISKHTQFFSTHDFPWKLNKCLLEVERNIRKQRPHMMNQTHTHTRLTHSHKRQTPSKLPEFFLPLLGQKQKHGNYHQASVSIYSGRSIWMTFSCSERAITRFATDIYFYPTSQLSIRLNT